MNFRINIYIALLLLVTIIPYIITTNKSYKTGNDGYQFSVKRVHAEVPVLNNMWGESSFSYNYNAAYVPLFNDDGKFMEDSLIVRCQMNTSQQYSPPQKYQVSQSVMSTVNFTKELLFGSINNKSIVLQPTEPYETFGTEDPRVVYRSKNRAYYMMYSAVEKNSDGTVTCRLALATSFQPNTKNWLKHGPIFADVNGTQWSKSGALLIRDNEPGPHYLFYGDSSFVPGLQYATSTDLLNYEPVAGVWMPKRENYFDSALVESGPMPLPLSNGNYLFLYNSARSGFNSSKPGYDLQYNVGWVILDGKDPTTIVARSDQPILSPALAWEKGIGGFLGLTPNVVFVEGWKQIGKDKFQIYYGAADSVIGIAEVSVTFSN